MQFKPTDALLSLDGWSLVLTCSVCGVTRTKPANELIDKYPRKTELHQVLPRLRCCGATPVSLEAVCSWVAKYRSIVPREDLSHLLGKPDC